MTIGAKTQQVPQVIDDYEAIMHNKTVIEANISILEQSLQRLARQKEQLLIHRTLLVQQAEKVRISKCPIGKLPMESIVPYLSAVDVCNMSATCSLFHRKCKSECGETLVSHITTPNDRTVSIADAIEMVDSICWPVVESIYIDAKRPSGKAFMEALALKVTDSTTTILSSLRKLKISAAAQSGSFLKNVFTFVASLESNQLREIHLSGFLSIGHVASIYRGQANSLEKFKVDYFVNGHESEIVPDFLPIMPNLRSLVYDVADVTEIPVELLTQRLEAVENKALVEEIYLPHVQITGDAIRIRELIDTIKSFDNLNQLVIRFRHLPLSVREIVCFRETFSSLPACCISDHFVVIQKNWCSWWPSLPEVWDRADKITGLSVFREQIDFESLGTSATREWLKLTGEQKNLWSTMIAPQVVDLYLKHSPKMVNSTASLRTSGSSSIRAVSV